MSVTTTASRASDALVWLSKVTSGGRPRYFAGKTGGGVTSGSSTEYDGGSKVPEVATEPSQIENIVVTLRYKAAIDHDWLKRMRKLVGVYTDTLTVLDTDADFNPLPGVTPDVYPDAVLVGVGGIDVDRNGTGTRTCDLTFAVSTEV